MPATMRYGRSRRLAVSMGCLEDSQISDTGLKNLDGLTQLRTLDLSRGGDGLARSFGGFKQMPLHWTRFA